MKDIAITIKNVTISYKFLKKVSIKKMLFSLRPSRLERFVAVDNVSFQIEKGKILGIVGKNGSGKSTLLKAIAGIFSPDSGNIDLHGNSVSLLAIGVGFQPNLTGRENIILSGLLLGFSKKQIMDKLDSIIDFADLGTFIDKPVKTYSSGMHSKLAFSITANLDSDIILIDEVLSVGDAKFKKKSFKKMLELIRDENRTVIIVSHSLSSLRKMCDEILWLHDGKVKMFGNKKEVLVKYKKFMEVE